MILTKEKVPNGLVFWWSTFYQKWNVTPYKGREKGETRRYEGRPISSHIRMKDAVLNSANTRFKKRFGTFIVVDPGYCAIWCDDAELETFLREQYWKLVCNEV